MESEGMKTLAAIPCHNEGVAIGSVVLKARKTAMLRGLTVIGTIGVLLDAKERGLVYYVKPLLDELIRKKIRISRELYNHALELAHESQS